MKRIEFADHRREHAAEIDSMVEELTADGTVNGPIWTETFLASGKSCIAPQPSF